ncbi:MAG TPA: hypothetical protein VNJ01_11105 [Bacteriovoracaceae bacterium]|nr:hypothetical protein [Bacteriovoracaceae bacterium]
MMDPTQSADEAGLKYVSDTQPGIRRRKNGKGFAFVDDDRGLVRNKKILERIGLLVIPPAWKDVWICRQVNGHLQVTGRDAKGRKQYRYHAEWTLLRNGTKFERMAALSKKLPGLRKKIAADLKLTGMPKEKVLAAVIKVMLITQSRVGNSSYALENESYGLTTILNKHAKIKGAQVRLAFRGKSGVDHDILFEDPQLSKILRRCLELPGEELFAYQDESGVIVDITSTMVNDYLKSSTGEDFTAKDLRTWGGTCKAVEILVKDEPLDLKEKHWVKRHLSVIKETAGHLHNTVAVCRKYYIHPLVFEADRKGKLHELWKSCGRCGKLASREEKLLTLILHCK